MSRGPIPDFPAQRPTVPEAIEAIRAYYAQEGNGAGGSLHIVLDDRNLGVGHIRFCREWASGDGDSEGVALAEMLLAMTPTQRRKAVTNA